MKPTPLKRIAIVLAVLLALLWGMSQLAHAAPVHLTDDRGRNIALAQAPQRIVSLLPSLAEAVCALDQCHRLVGVDRYTNCPEATTKLPQVGGGLDPQIETILALRPDVVLMATSSRAADRLEALGIAVVALEPKTHADVQRVLGKIGQLLGVQDAQHVWRHIDAAVTAAAQSMPASARTMRVYFEVNPGPFAASENSFIGQTLTRLGVGNIVPAALGPFPKLNPEFIVRADPDLIMVGSRSAAGLLARPGWAQMRALREGHLCQFTPEQSDVLIRPGPRMAQAARLMADCISTHSPKAFKR